MPRHLLVLLSSSALALTVAAPTSAQPVQPAPARAVCASARCKPLNCAAPQFTAVVGPYADVARWRPDLRITKSGRIMCWPPRTYTGTATRTFDAHAASGDASSRQSSSQTSSVTYALTYRLEKAAPGGQAASYVLAGPSSATWNQVWSSEFAAWDETSSFSQSCKSSGGGTIVGTGSLGFLIEFANGVGPTYRGSAEVAPPDDAMSTDCVDVVDGQSSSDHTTEPAMTGYLDVGLAGEFPKGSFFSRLDGESKTPDGAISWHLTAPVGAILRPGERWVSENGIRFIMGMEGFCDSLYDTDIGGAPCTAKILHPSNPKAGSCTIGYGHLIHLGPCTAADVANRDNFGWSRARGRMELEAELPRDIRAVRDFARDVHLSQCEFDALVSFHYNTHHNPRTWEKLIAGIGEGDLEKLRNRLLHWGTTAVGGEGKLPSLSLRRQLEVATFDRLPCGCDGWLHPRVERMWKKVWP